MKNQIKMKQTKRSKSVRSEASPYGWTRLILILFLVSIVFSCKDDDNNEPTPDKSGISGQWEFTLTPDQNYMDTTEIKGHTAAEFDVYSSVNEEVYLYQDDAGNILGFSGPHKLLGTITGNKISLIVYNHPEGNYLPERPVEEMTQFSRMELTLDGYGMMEGTGSYLPYETFPNITQNTYTVIARRINLIEKSGISTGSFKEGLAVTGWENDICKVIFSIGSWVLSSITDGVIRTMSSDCWLHKDGGGYYAFGHEGPGSLFPILTQSVYYPYEWSACKVRTYGFDITIESENISYTVLKNSVINSPPVEDLFKKLGFTGIPELEQALDDFYTEFGGFGISIFYDTHTNNLGLYVNHKKGSSYAAEHSTLVQSMKVIFDGAVGTVYVLAGSSISDDWHLRRSDFLVCNTPIIIGYVIGTHNVKYN